MKNKVVKILKIPETYTKLNPKDFINRLGVVKHVTFTGREVSWVKVLVIGKQEIWLTYEDVEEVS
jgi:hypothetical protein